MSEEFKNSENTSLEEKDEAKLKISNYCNLQKENQLFDKKTIQNFAKKIIVKIKFSLNFVVL